MSEAFWALGRASGVVLLVLMTVTLEGRTSEVPVTAGMVLDAVRAARAEVPFACRGGVCGTCRARVVSGEVAMRRNYALEPDEVARGYVLTCQGQVTAPGVHLDYDA